ncbi:hypothetical protein MMC13_001959 [Lambiella insularis]|nr:hypothetical protein [Lambiella insularis]
MPDVLVTLARVWRRRADSIGQTTSTRSHAVAKFPFALSYSLQRCDYSCNEELIPRVLLREGLSLVDAEVFELGLCIAGVEAAVLGVFELEGEDESSSREEGEDDHGRSLDATQLEWLIELAKALKPRLPSLQTLKLSKHCVQRMIDRKDFNEMKRVQHAWTTVGVVVNWYE